MRRLSRRSLLAWAGLGVLAPGCLSPTLPLPPPSVPDAKDLGNGQFQLKGAIPVLGTVIFRNERTELVYGQADVTTYMLVVDAQNNDTLALWYETDGDMSTTVPFIVGRANPIVNDGGAR